MVVGLGAESAPAQNPARRPAAGADARKMVVKVRSLEGVGARSAVQTPQYRVDTGDESLAAPENWHRIKLEYDTDPEWIDELTFRYYALLKSRRGREFTLLVANVTYVDVAKGRRHLSTMFIHPTTLERYGTVEAVAVELMHKGEVQATESVPEVRGGTPWWKDERVTPQTGRLLKRSETPFALINMDRYENIKPGS